MSKRALWFDGQRVLADHLTYEQVSRIAEEDYRRSDYWTDGTILDAGTNFNVTVDGTSTNTLNIGHGLGYLNGERISISSDSLYDATSPYHTTDGVSTPLSTGNLKVALQDYTPGTLNYVWLQYLQTIDGVKTINPADGSAHYIEADDGYRVLVNTTNPPANPVSNALFLARATANGLTGTITGLTDLNSRLYSKLSVINGITTSSLTTGSVTTDKIADNSIVTGKIAAQTVRGSTANSGGSAQEIAQGTISTPDLRLGAVTTISNNSTLSFSGIGGSVITSTVITTSGGPVFLIAKLVATITADGSGKATLDGWLDRDGTGGTTIDGNYTHFGGWGFAASSRQFIEASIITIETPAAGTYTYNLKAEVGVGTPIGSIQGNLIAIELKK